MPNFAEILALLPNGHSVREKLSSMESAAGLSENERRSIRERRLSSLLQECFEYVEAYRPYRSLRNKAKNQPFEVLAELPAMTRDEYFKNPNVYYNPNLKQGQLARSGARLTVGYSYPVSKDAWSADYAARVFVCGLLGLSYPAKHMVMRGRLHSASFVNGLAGSVKRSLLENGRELFGSYINAGRLNAYAEALSDPKLNYCVGTPSVMNALAQLFTNSNILPKPLYKGVFAVGETILPEERENIEKVFGVRAYSAYTTRDDGLIACECSHGGMHIIEDNFIVEAPDGRVTITNLHNNAAPRMRYVAGDTAEISDGPCPCGREGKLLTSLNGKKMPLYTAPDGRVIPGRVIDIAAEQHYNIVRYRLTQSDPQHAELAVDLRTSAALDEASALHSIVREFMPGALVDLKSSVARSN